jgi:hypothetical protein
MTFPAQGHDGVDPRPADRGGALSSRVCFVFWTRWPKVPGAAWRIVEECLRFAVDALGGHQPAAIVLVKTPGKGTRLPEDLRVEEKEWRDACEQQQARCAGLGTAFEFVYLPANQPVTAAWHMSFALSRFWERADILAFPTMDFIDARLEPPFQLTPLDGQVEEAVAGSARGAARHFGKMLERVAVSRGLVIGGYKTRETNVSPVDWKRRGGQAAKDLLEHAIRCYASAVFSDNERFQALLTRYPDLRLRSEILVLHTELWLELLSADLLRLEPWEATIQLILNALKVGAAVDQIEFEWLVEEGGKPDAVILEQLERGQHCVRRLAASLQSRSIKASV